MGHGATDLSVPAFAQAHGQPGIRALLAVQLDLHRLEFLAVDDSPPTQRVKGQVAGRAVHAHPIAPQPAGRGQFQPALQLAVIGQQQKPFGIEVKAPHAHHPRQVARQGIKDRLAALFVGFRRHEADRLVIQPQPRLLRRVHRLAVDPDLVGGQHVQSGAGDLVAVHRHAAFQDHAFRIAAAGDACAGHGLGDPLALCGGGGGQLFGVGAVLGVGDVGFGGQVAVVVIVIVIVRRIVSFVLDLIGIDGGVFGCGFLGRGDGGVVILGQVGRILGGVLGGVLGHGDLLRIAAVASGWV